MYEPRGDKTVKDQSIIINFLKGFILQPENEWIKEVLPLIHSEDNDISRRNLDLFKQFLIQHNLSGKINTNIFNNLIISGSGYWKEGVLDLIATLTNELSEKPLAGEELVTKFNNSKSLPLSHVGGAKALDEAISVFSIGGRKNDVAVELEELTRKLVRSKVTELLNNEAQAIKELLDDILRQDLRSELTPDIWIKLHDDNTLTKLLGKYVGSFNIRIIPICRTYEELQLELEKIKPDISGQQYVIPLNTNTLTGELCSDSNTDTNYWVGLHIVCSNSNKVDIAYIDPMGRAIASGVAELITAILRNINELAEVTLTEPLNYRGIQYVKQTSDRKLEGNLNDCGPMLVYALACEVRATINTLPHVNSKHVSETLGDFLRQSFAREDDFNSTIHPGVLTLPEIRIQKLAHKESTEELKQLVELLHELGQKYISLADSAEDLNTKLSYYNEAAVFYNYIITITNENDNLKSSPEVEHLKQEIPVYDQLSSIQSKLIQTIGGNQDTILKVITETNIDQVSRKDLLQRLRPDKKESIKLIDETSEQYVQTSRGIFRGIADSMKQYLASLYEETQNILGEPPCAYCQC